MTENIFEDIVLLLSKYNNVLIHLNYKLHKSGKILIPLMSELNILSMQKIQYLLYGMIGIKVEFLMELLIEQN